MKVFDINPMGGGRILRDRLWFYLTYREWGADNTVPGMFINRNAGNPNAWTVDFDTSRQAFVDARNRNGIARITWQATPRNKINLHWSEQYNTANSKGGGTATLTTEASGRQLYQPSHIQQATWSSPVSSRLLLEAGWGTYISHFMNPQPRTDGTHNDRMIRAQEQLGEIPNLISRMPAGPVGGGFSGPKHNIGTRANLRASAVVRHRRAQHEVRLSGRVQQSDAALVRLQRIDQRPAQRRRAESVDARPPWTSAASSTCATCSRPPSMCRINGRPPG